MITDDHLRDLFERRADDVHITPGIPSTLLRRVRRRQRAIAAASAAAVVGLFVGAWLSAGFLSRSQALPPAERDEAPMTGQPPTASSLSGIWIRHEGASPQANPLLVRFSPDGRVALDDLGLLDTTPAIVGTYAVSGDTITFRVGPKSKVCNSADTWAWRAGVTQAGRLHIVFIEDGTGRCSQGIGTEWAFTRVSPGSPAGAEIAADEPTGKGIPPPLSQLTGIWLREGGELLSLRWDSSYAIDDGGRLDTTPNEVGDFQMDGRTLTFTSGAESRTCAEGAVRVLKQVRLDGRTLRGIVSKDECTDSVGAEQTWIRLAPLK